MKKPKFRMRKYVLIHADPTARGSFSSQCAARQPKIVSRRPIPKRPIYCPYGNGVTLWRRAERA